uniref:Transmembrane protein 109 n=1 Tax=Sphenodon punctatus TaxID=8508 RepID=A0A8D0LD78_SPHPU
MTIWDSRPWSYRQALLQPAMAVLMMSIVFCHVAMTSAQHRRSEHWREADVHADSISQVVQGLKETLEGWIGRETLQLVNENISDLVWLLSSGISAGLITMSGILGQILSAFGMDGNHLVQSLKLDPAQVQILLLWSLAAVIGYWVLSLLLGLVLSILSHIMWGLKVVLFLTCFVFIVSMVPNVSMKALLLLALLTLYALLGRLSGSRRSGKQLEAKVYNLELQIEELRRRQRRGSPRNLEEE